MSKVRCITRMREVPPTSCALRHTSDRQRSIIQTVLIVSRNCVSMCTYLYLLDRPLVSQCRPANDSSTERRTWSGRLGPNFTKGELPYWDSNELQHLRSTLLCSCMPNLPCSSSRSVLQPSSCGSVTQRPRHSSSHLARWS